jgi:hypothetical protein
MGGGKEEPWSFVLATNYVNVPKTVSVFSFAMILRVWVLLDSET